MSIKQSRSNPLNFTRRGRAITPIGIAFLALIAALIIVIPLSLTVTKYEHDFLVNILSEAHGMILDILVIGIFILWLNHRADKVRRIQGYEDELEDYLPWKEPEATYRITGIIKRLNKLGVSNVSLVGAYLKEAKLLDANLQGALLSGANLEGADLRGANLQGAFFQRTILNNAQLTRANLQEATLRAADLQGALLQGASLRKARLLETNLMGACLENAILQEATLAGVNFQGVRGLTIEQISKAKTLYGARNLDESLISQIRENYPHLLEMPKDE